MTPNGHAADAAKNAPRLMPKPLGEPQSSKCWDKMVKTCCIAIVILALLSVCSQTQARVGLQTGEDVDEYAVYSAVINRAISEAKAKFAVIGGTTGFDKRIWNTVDANAVLQNLKPVTKETLQDFVHKNQEPRRLSERLKLNVGYVFLGRQSSQNDTGKAPAKVWPASAVFGLSRVGFNDKKDLALVYFSINCGIRCGQGDLVLLSRSDRGWLIVKKYRLWIS